jgi:hypothetical protein
MNSHSKPTPAINPAYEAEIKKIIDALWENRFNLNLRNLETLHKFANKRH